MTMQIQFINSVTSSLRLYSCKRNCLVVYN